MYLNFSIHYKIIQLSGSKILIRYLIHYEPAPILSISSLTILDKSIQFKVHLDNNFNIFLFVYFNYV